LAGPPRRARTGDLEQRDPGELEQAGDAEADEERRREREREYEVAASVRAGLSLV